MVAMVLWGITQMAHYQRRVGDVLPFERFAVHHRSLLVNVKAGSTLSRVAHVEHFGAGQRHCMDCMGEAFVGSLPVQMTWCHESKKNEVS